MGVIHYAYSFDRKQAGVDVVKYVDSHKQLTASVYEAQIAQASGSCDGLGMRFLEDLCFDQGDWTSETTGSFDRMEKLITLSLAKYITGMHKLSQSSFALLEILLPMFGWKTDMVGLLLMGRQFNHLIYSFGCLDPDLRGAHMAKNPSWLPFEDAQKLSAGFQSLHEDFIHPTERCLKAVGAAQSRMFLGDKSSTELMQKAFDEMTSRFALCAQTGYDLLLVNEIARYLNAPLAPV